MSSTPLRPLHCQRTLAAFVATVFAAAALASCRSSPDQTISPTLRVAGTVWDDFDAKVSSGPVSIEGETDYQNFEVGGGATFFEPADSGGQRKVARADVSVGAAEFGDIDAIEIAGGGRVYFGQHPTFQPFLSAYLVGTLFDDVANVEVGNQLGGRAGGGLEVALTEQVFVDVTVDYTVPFVAAETDTTPTIDTEVEGFALRIGLGFIF
ncbi:MAG: hypothetical protein AAF726_17835 [Planctomycetota bacterium]